MSVKADSLRTTKCYCFSVGGSGVVQSAVFSHKIAFIESQADLSRESIQTHEQSHYVFSLVAWRLRDLDLESAKPAVAKRDAS